MVGYDIYLRKYLFDEYFLKGGNYANFHILHYYYIINYLYDKKPYKD